MNMVLNVEEIVTSLTIKDMVIMFKIVITYQIIILVYVMKAGTIIL